MNRLLTILVIFVVGGSYLKEKINTKFHKLDTGGKTNIIQQTQALITPEAVSSGVYGYDKNGQRCIMKNDEYGRIFDTQNCRLSKFNTISFQ